jgi:hypothetical protein
MSTFNVGKLQNIVQQVLIEERLTEQLRKEIKRVLGVSVVVDGDLKQITSAANLHVETLERTGKTLKENFNTSLLMKFASNNDANVRAFVARVAPQKLLSKLAFDKNNAVRAVVARRLPLNAVSEMLKRYPKDDQLQLIRKEKSLTEGGLPQPEVNSEPFTLYADERLGDAIKQWEGEELSDVWYRQKAIEFMQDYGRNIEDCWEEAVVKRYVSSVRATSGVFIDPVKLLNAIKDLLSEREERVEKRSALKESIAFLKRSSLNESFDETKDSVLSLLESKKSYSFQDNFESLFCVKYSTPSQNVKNYMLCENLNDLEQVPHIAKLPHNEVIRVHDEKAINEYCRSWNNTQKLKGNHLTLEWNMSPNKRNLVLFKVNVK